MTISQSFFGLRPAEQINAAIAALPVAEKGEVFVKRTSQDGPQKTEKHMAIFVGDKLVSIPSDKYVLKQHEEAFRPVINGLSVSGVSNFRFMTWSTARRASLAILVGDSKDGVNFGFKCTNSFDRSTAIGFGAKAYKQSSTLRLVEKEHVLVWGIRQVCSNGMVMRVPLKTCKYIDAEIVTEVKTLLSQSKRILHLGKDVDEKLESLQYVVEAFLLLKGPLDMMILDAQKYKITSEKAREFITKYVGKRRLDKYLELYGHEEQTLWGLYNSITFLASHEAKLTPSIREGLLGKAAVMMEEVLITRK